MLFVVYSYSGTFSSWVLAKPFLRGGDVMKKKDLLIEALVVIIFLLIFLLFIVIL